MHFHLGDSWDWPGCSRINFPINYYRYFRSTLDRGMVALPFTGVDVDKEVTVPGSIHIHQLMRQPEREINLRCPLVEYAA